MFNKSQALTISCLYAQFPLTDVKAIHSAYIGPCSHNMQSFIGPCSHNMQSWLCQVIWFPHEKVGANWLWLVLQMVEG